MIGLPPNPHDLEGQWFSVRPLAGVALVWTLTAQTNPAWLDLPGAHGFRRHSPGGRKVTQASPPRQSTPPRGSAKTDDFVSHFNFAFLIEARLKFD